MTITTTTTTKSPQQQQQQQQLTITTTTTTINKRTSMWIGEQENIMLKTRENSQKPLNWAKFDCFCHFYVPKKIFFGTYSSTTT